MENMEQIRTFFRCGRITYNSDEYDPKAQTGVIKNDRNAYEWYKYGLRHREDGPAIMDPNGVYLWFIDGKKVDEEFALQYAITNNNREALKSILWKKYLE